MDVQKKMLSVLLFTTLSYATPTAITGYELRLISAGDFQMGSAESEEGRFNDEDQHHVTLTNNYWIGRTEVTQGLWKEVMKENPSSYPACGSNCPVDNVTWCDAITFANKLSEIEGLDMAYTVPAGLKVGLSDRACNAVSMDISVNWRANGYRLPSEAEWEYAARGNQQALLYSGGDSADTIGWHSFNSGRQSHRVCQKRSNAFGLCDMSGNVSEWVWDRYDRLPAQAVVNPKGSRVGTTRVVRGGSCRNEPRYLRVSNRGGFYPGQRYDSLGFRLARSDR